MKIPDDPAIRPHENILLPAFADANIRKKVADFCEDLRKREAYGLGFIPAVAYDQAQLRNRLVVELENDEPCGFALWAQRKSVVRIHQCAIVEDARRVKHATHLVCSVLNQQAARKGKLLRLRVADDLPANHFWQAIGCKIVGNQPGGYSFRRTINLYQLEISNKMKLVEGIIHANLTAGVRELAKEAMKSVK